MSRRTQRVYPVQAEDKNDMFLNPETISLAE